jgi:hypothetical protein
MRRTRPRATSARVRQARAGIEKWRKTRKKRSPMPEALWAAAVELSQSDGVYPIARALRVNYQSLQCRVAMASSSTAPGTGAPRGFVELSSPLPIAPPPLPSGPVLELSDGNGATLTIRLPSASELDVERLARAFLHQGLG